MSYKIFIDGEPYEGSSSFTEAKHLYQTVDQTCLHHHWGHEKSLVVHDKVLEKDIIKPQD